MDPDMRELVQRLQKALEERDGVRVGRAGANLGK
jgi:hypothetical protein